MTSDLSVALFFHYHFFHDIALADLIDYLKAFHDFTKYGVVAVQVTGRTAAVAYKELGPSRIPTCVGHGKNATVVILVFSLKLAVNGIAGATVTNAVGAATLNDKVGNDAVKGQTVVESLFCKSNEVVYRVGGVFLKKLNFHDALFGVNFCRFHRVILIRRAS